MGVAMPVPSKVSKTIRVSSALGLNIARKAFADRLVRRLKAVSPLA